MDIQDKNVLEVVTEYAYRAQRGFEKYGTTTERTDIDLEGWLKHLQEELMDATVYIQRIRNELKSLGNPGQQLQVSKETPHQGNAMHFNGNVDHYLQATDLTAIYPEAGTGSETELFYLSLGLTSEAGEVAGKIKKFIRDGKLDVGNIAYELGDVFYYLVRMCDAIGYSPSDIMDINMNKLLKRKQAGTLGGSGDHR